MIELIVVIVILGVLAATVLPKYLDLDNDARTEALNGMAAAAASAMLTNYGGCAAVSHATTGAAADKCKTIRYCDDLDAVLLSPLAASGYAADHADLGAVNGVTGTCTLTHTASGRSKSFSGIAAGN